MNRPPPKTLDPIEWDWRRLDEQWRDVGQVEATGRGEATVAFVERLLRETGVLKALAPGKWMP